MVTVYLLECGDGTLYTGIASDLRRRLRQHAAGKGAKYTRGRGPLTLRYAELQPDRRSALRREIEIKKLSRAQKLALAERVCLLPDWAVETVE
jgi:putative endonuclease